MPKPIVNEGLSDGVLSGGGLAIAYEQNAKRKDVQGAELKRSPMRAGDISSFGLLAVRSEPSSLILPLTPVTNLPYCVAVFRITRYQPNEGRHVHFLIGRRHDLIQRQW